MKYVSHCPYFSDIQFNALSFELLWSIEKSWAERYPFKAGKCNKSSDAVVMVKLSSWEPLVHKSN